MSLSPALQLALAGAPIAHRGLWRVGDRPENSLAAFEAACAARYGIELDVRLTADGEAVVFHDETLDRMTALSGLVEEQPLADLAKATLLGSDQRIPTLKQALELIGTRSLVLVELKTPPGQEGPLERQVAGLLAAHPGPAAVLSFNRPALAWMLAHAPDIARGVNVDGKAAHADASAAQPDFISVELGLCNDERVQAFRTKGPAIAWTARSRAEYARARERMHNVMFEGFAP